MKKITSLFVMAVAAMTMSAQGTRTIYLDANIWAGAGVDPVYAVHVWNTGEEDAADYWFEPVDGNIFKADIRDDATKAIFLRKDPAAENVGTDAFAGEWNRSETDIPADKDKYRILSWGSGEGTGEHGEWMNNGDVPAPAADVVIMVKKPAAWSSMKMWAWGSSDAEFMAQFSEGWPGVDMVAIGDDWYKFTLKSDASFIVNGGDDSVKTPDSAPLSANSCFTISETPEDGKYPLIAADCPDDTAIEEVAVKANASVKKVINGQLVIIREGKAFNALGAEMK